MINSRNAYRSVFYVFHCLKTINVTEGLLCVIRNLEKNIQI